MGLFVERFKYELDASGGYLMNPQKLAKVVPTFASVFLAPTEALRCMAAMAHLLRNTFGIEEQKIINAVQQKPQ